MKKFILNIALALALVVPTFAAPITRTTTLAAGGFSNLVSAFKGSALVTDIIVTAPTTNSGSIRMIDTPTNSLTFVVAPYSNITQYATNVITTYTNFFGVPNSFTNVGLVTVTNSTAQTTNNYATPFYATVNTNTSQLFLGQNYQFNNGVWATNTSIGGSVTVTITYEQ